MSLEEKLEITQKEFPEEYQTAIRLSYPKEYIPIACRWLHNNYASDTAMKYFLLQWKQYVKDAVDIESIRDGYELMWVVFDYREYGYRTLHKSFLQN